MGGFSEAMLKMLSVNLQYFFACANIAICRTFVCIFLVLSTSSQLYQVVLLCLGLTWSVCVCVCVCVQLTVHICVAWPAGG